jgi:hypothetical protein
VSGLTEKNQELVAEGARLKPYNPDWARFEMVAATGPEQAETS